MALVRWNPTQDLMQMREEMDRMFNQVFGRGGDGEEATWGRGLWAPPVDIYETEDAFMLKAELPGFRKAVAPAVVALSSTPGARRAPPGGQDRGGAVPSRERAYGAFERSFLLPATVDQDGVQATDAE
jgi:HSP20 family protein